MFKKLFGIKEEKQLEEIIVAPLTGRVVNLEDVPDPTFSQKMMGEGLAVEPSEGEVVSPIDGEIVQIFPTKHAIGVRGKSGIEVLIHIGIDTVGMSGEGFQTHVKENIKVTAGQKLVSFDLELIKEKASSTITPIVFTNSEIIDFIEKTNQTNAQKGETEIVKLKVKE